MELRLEQAMKYQVFAVAGNTLDPEKYAFRIKEKLLEKGYTVYAVGKELTSFNDIPEEIDIIDLCIHPVKGLALLQSCTKPVKGVIIQPGAESDEIIAYLKAQKIPFVEGCALVGCSLYARHR